jgi:hypothetical protein
VLGRFPRGTLTIVEVVFSLEEPFESLEPVKPPKPPSDTEEGDELDGFFFFPPFDFPEKDFFFTREVPDFFDFPDFFWAASSGIAQKKTPMANMKMLIL